MGSIYNEGGLITILGQQEGVRFILQGAGMEVLVRRPDVSFYWLIGTKPEHVLIFFSSKHYLGSSTKVFHSLPAIIFSHYNNLLINLLTHLLLSRTLKSSKSSLRLSLFYLFQVSAYQNQTPLTLHLPYAATLLIIVSLDLTVYCLCKQRL